MKETIIKSITAIICVAIVCLSMTSAAGKYADAVKEASAAASQAGSSGEVSAEEEQAAMDDFFGDDASTDEGTAGDAGAAGDTATDAGTAGDTATDEGTAGDTATDAGDKGEGTTSAPAATSMTKSEFVAFLNAETAKIAKSGEYSFNRKCEYTKKIDVGNATDTLNGIISGIDENSNLDTVVGGFLGIGTKEGTYPKDELSDNYKVKATTLKDSDLGSFTAKNGVYTFTLADATNPKKDNSTPLSRFTNDFITHEEVVNGIADFTTLIKVNSTDVNYKNIKVAVTVVDGKITNIKYAESFDAKLVLKAVFTINGSGAATTYGTFSNIKY